MQGQLLIVRPDIKPADALRRFETWGQKRLVGKNKAEQDDMWTKDQGRIKYDFEEGKCISSFLVSSASRSTK